MKARLPQGYGGGPGNMQSMVRQAQKMQEDMAALQEELAATEYPVKVGGGAVELVITGAREVKSLNIQPEVVDPEDIEMLQDLIISAINEGLRAVETDSETRMNAITGGMGGMGIPGLF